MKNNAKITISFFILSLVTLISTVFAWVALSKRSNIGGIGGNISDFTDLVVFHVKRSDDDVWHKIETKKDMEDVFWTTKPGMFYTFKINIENKSQRSFEVFSSLNGITTTYSEDNGDFDLRNVFYIKDGVVNITKKVVNITKKDHNITGPPLATTSNEPSTVHGQSLNKFRLNNLIDSRNNITLFTPIEMNPTDILEITFTLVYDGATKDTRYQDNQLNIEGIFIYGQ